MKFLPLLLIALTPTLDAQTVISTYAGGGSPPTPIAAAQASISPVGIAFDQAGNLYFSSFNCVFKVDLNGTTTRIAGDSRQNDSGDGGLAINAELFVPQGLAFDRNGNLYIAELYRIRKISAAGIITTVAGIGTEGSDGDGGPAVAAQLGGVYGLTFDASGNLYFSQTYFSAVRKISTNGTISTVAGNLSGGFSGDNGPATKAQLNQPEGIAIDASGNLYIADYSNNRVRKVSAAGVITTVVGNGTCCFSGEGGPAVSAQLNFPTSVIVDGGGNLYISDSERVRMVSAAGVLTTIAGGGVEPAGSNGPALSVQINQVSDLALDAQSDLYLADQLDNRIRVISRAGVISTAVGNGTFNYSGDGLLAVNAQMGSPGALAFDGSGNLFIGDWENPIVRKVSAVGIVTTVAGNGSAGYSGDGGPATSAQLSRTPSSGLAINSAGTMYIPDFYNNCVRAVSPDGIITTVAGRGTGGDGGLAINAQLNGPGAVAVDSAGNLYIAEIERVRKVSPDGIISTVAGNGQAGFSGDGGLAISAELDGLRGLAVDSSGNLYIVDSNNNRIRKVSSNGIITTVVGGGTQRASCPPTNEAGTAAVLYYPLSLALDATGNLYISDNTDCVKKLSPAGVLTTVAGNGVFGYAGDGGPPTSAALAAPVGLAVDRNGNLAIADFFARVVREIEPAAAPITVATVASATSNNAGVLVPGEIVVIKGTGLGPSQIVSATAQSNGLFGTALAGTTVLFDGNPSPIVYTSATQVAAIVPYEVAGNFTSQITVAYQGHTSIPFSEAVASSLPAIFTANSTGTGAAAAVNQDGTINSATTPAGIGTVIVLYATGEGQTTPAGIDGKLATAPFPQPNQVVSVTIGGQPAQVLYAGGAPGEVAGLMQINAVIPASIQTGNSVPVVVRVGGAISQAGVTIFVQ